MIFDVNEILVCIYCYWNTELSDHIHTRINNVFTYQAAIGIAFYYYWNLNLNSNTFFPVLYPTINV